MEAPKKKGGAALIVGGIIVLLALILGLGKKSGPPTPPPANPIVNVGDDQAVTLDATSHAEITIPFTVVADNPVNLAWTSTSGPAPVAFSPQGPNQEIAAFQTPGTYLIRLTATDVTDDRAVGFDELVVTVNAVPLGAILVPGELKLDGFAIYTLTRNLGATISFVWPVTNVGDLQGAAFIQITEAETVIGTGAPFPIDPGQTTAVNFNPVVNLPAGVHTLVAKVMEGLDPGGVPVGASQTITLTVVTIPVLAAVGPPTINNIVGPTTFSIKAGSVLPISWDCQNTGGGPGLARLRIEGTPVQSMLVTIPGFSIVTLLLSYTPGLTAILTLSMVDDTGVILAQWQYQQIVF